MRFIPISYLAYQKLHGLLVFCNKHSKIIKTVIFSIRFLCQALKTENLPYLYQFFNVIKHLGLLTPRDKFFLSHLKRIPSFQVVFVHGRIVINIILFPNAHKVYKKIVLKKSFEQKT